MNGMPDLNTLSFVTVVFLLAGYILLDGFDFGVGILHFFAKRGEDRRRLLGAIAPFWDGNEVWLVTAGGALFAAFPKVYAAVFSGFYLAFVLFLFVLIFRALAIEFRGKFSALAWRGFWDAAFSVSSGLAGFLIGMVFGNLIQGIPLGTDGEFTGTFLGLFNPYALFSGLFAVSFFSMHGALYLVLRTDGDLREKSRRWAGNAALPFVLFFILLSAWTAFGVPWVTLLVKQSPVLFMVPPAILCAIFISMQGIRRHWDFTAFLFSGFSMLAIIGTFAAALFPNLVISSSGGYPLTVYNACSSPKTLGIILRIASVGMPAVLIYTGYVYWVFRGKTASDRAYY